MRKEPREGLARSIRIVTDHDGEADRSLDLGGVAPRASGRVLEDSQPRRRLPGRPVGVPTVGRSPDQRDTLTRTGRTDEDRQVILDRPWGAHRVAHRVEATRVGDGLAVEQPADEPDGLVEAIDPLAEARPELEPEGVMLTLEPGRTDPQDRPAIAQVVERRRKFGGHPGVAKRVRTDHEAKACVLRERGQGGQDGPALEHRLLPRTEDRVQMIPGPNRVPARSIGEDRRVSERWPVRGLGPELGAEADRGHARGRGLSPTRGGRGRP